MRIDEVTATTEIRYQIKTLAKLKPGYGYDYESEVLFYNGEELVKGCINVKYYLDRVIANASNTSKDQKTTRKNKPDSN